MGIEMSRPARAIKLWFTIQAMGTDLLSDVIDYTFFIMNVAKKEIEALPEFVLTSKPMCGTLTFRYEPADVVSERYNELSVNE